MLDIKRLENRWKIYKIKSLMPYFIVAVLILVLLTTAYNHLLTPEKLVVEKKSVVQKQIKIAPVVVQKKVEEIKQVKKEVVKKLVLIPYLNFIENLKNRVYNKPEKKSTYTKEKVMPLKILKEHVKEKKSIMIKRQDSYKDIKDVIKRFNKNQNPALSLFVAKKYYALGEYDKSYNYALITNNLSSDIEPSWIIFSKSLVKLDKKEKAIDVLKNYIKHSSSSRAKNLLNDINKGAFK